MLRVKAFVRRNWPELLVSLWPLLYFWPLVLGTRRLFWGLPLLQFVPWRVLVRAAFFARHLPLWTDALGMGAPLLANLQSAVFYPPNFLALLLPPDYVIGLLAVLHLSLGGLGMVRLARHLGLSPFAAALAGLAFGFSDYFVARLWFITINNAAAWLPWLVMAADKTLCGNKRAPFWLAVLLATQILAGHAQTTFYTLLLVSGWGCWRAWQLRNGRGLLTMAFAGALGFLLVAVQLLPTAELLVQSQRSSAVGYEFATTYSLWPWRLLSFLAPTFFGHPAEGNFWAYPTYWEDAAYIGLLPLAMAFYALLRSRKTGNRSLVIFLFGIGLVSVLLALGKFAPFFPYLYRYVPGFDMFQAPARLLLLYVFSLSLLAGFGFEMLRPSPRLQYWSRLGIAAAGLIVLIGLLGWVAASGGGSLLELRAPQAERLFTAGRALTISGVLGLATLILLLRLPTQRTRRWMVVTLGLLIFDLGLAAYDLIPLIDPRLYSATNPSAKPVQNAVGDGRVFYFAADEYQVRFERVFVLDDFGDSGVDKWLEARAWLLPNFAVLDGINFANNFDPLLAGAYSDFIEAVEAAPLRSQEKLLQIAGVSVVVSPIPRAPWDAIYENGDQRIYRIVAGQRVRFVSQACTVPSSSAAFALMNRPEFDPDTLVVIQTQVAAAPACSKVSIENRSPSIADLRLQKNADPHHIAIEIDTQEEGWLVLADTHYPGWTTFLDGVPIEHFRANGSFRAVPVPAGEHQIEFTYSPRSFSIGFGLSLLGVVLWIGGWFLITRRA